MLNPCNTQKLIIAPFSNIYGISVKLSLSIHWAIYLCYFVYCWTYFPMAVKPLNSQPILFRMFAKSPGNGEALNVWNCRLENF